MPNYVTHVIMANEFFDQMILEKEFLLDIKNSDIKTFSIGQDYTFMNQKLFEKAHNKEVQAYFINLITYIADNKLYNNEKIMSYLYGQIAHFALDSTLHPFIYAKEKATKKTSIISQHTTTEYYIDDYITKKKLKKDVKDLDYNYLDVNIFNDKKLEKLINEIYSKTYKDKKTSLTYIRTLIALKSLIKASKFKIKDKSLLKKVLKYEKYFKDNNINEEYILNKNKNIWTNPFSGKISTESFYELNQKAINKAIELSIEANNYLYKRKNQYELCLAFPNTSYDTGIDCKYGKHFNHIKRKEKNYVEQKRNKKRY